MIGGQEVGETNVAPGGWPAGRTVDTYINMPFPGPTCKLKPARSKRVGFQVGTECGKNFLKKLVRMFANKLGTELSHTQFEHY